MKNPKICAVVLNYKVYEETITCVNSLLNLDYDNFEVVVVENGSNNDSLEKLNEIFSGNRLVHILPSAENLGFARGNNLGIVFAREELKADFVFVTNSDIVVPANLFKDVSRVECGEIGVISPTVYRADGNYQLPNENTNDIKARIWDLVVRLLIAKFRPPIKTKKSYKNNNEEKHKKVEIPDKWNDFVLQGCAYFLTPAFFDKYSKLYPKTFLYWEEINLLYYLYKANLKTLLIKTEPLIHKDKGTTNLITGNLSKFQLKHSFKSMLKSIPLFFMSYKMIVKKF